MSYDNTNRGILSRNDRKEKAEHPDMKGSINVDGVEYWLDGWTKESGPQSQNPGRKFLSLSIKPKDAKPVSKPAGKPAPKSTGFDDMDDEIPF